MNTPYIIAMWCLWATLAIFVHGSVIVYLKVTSASFIYKQKMGISVAIPLFGSVFLCIYRPLIYMCNICIDSE